AWHYIAITAGFQIPDFETKDPLSGDQMKEGDLVLGMVNQTFSDGALHGIWVKWDSVKAELIKELQADGFSTTNVSGSVSGVSDSSLIATLASLGVTIQNGITHIQQLIVDTFEARVAKIQKLEMTDQSTGQVYCIWIENGDWKKVPGICDSIDAAGTTPGAASQSDNVAPLTSDLQNQTDVGVPGSSSDSSGTAFESNVPGTSSSADQS